MVLRISPVVVVFNLNLNRCGLRSGVHRPTDDGQYLALSGSLNSGVPHIVCFLIVGVVYRLHLYNEVL